MRLSEWRVVAPHRDSMSTRVLGVLEPVLTALGTGTDPECWVIWGEDPGVRYQVLVPTPAGLVRTNVRVNIPQEGPRAAGKLTRWGRAQVGDLAVETQGGHRLVSVTLEGEVLKGVDFEADLVCAFMQLVFARIDGRVDPAPAVAARSSGRPRKPQIIALPATTTKTRRPGRTRTST